MFRDFFGNKNKRLSKVEYWKKWEFFEILEDLHTAYDYIVNFKPDDAASDKSLKEFSEKLCDAIDEVEEGNKNDLSMFYDLFSTGGEWQRITSEGGEELRLNIYKRAKNWKDGNG